MKYLFVGCVLLSMSVQAQNNCNDPKVHQFDFWIGKWTVYKNGTDTIVGHNEIKPIAGGCSLLESYQSARSNYVGNSLNKYNLVTGKWQQFWVDSGGLTLFIEGQYNENKMIMTSSDIGADGKTTMNRITWFKNADATVRQLWEQSTDNGNSWSVAFDGIYKKAGS